MKFPSYAARVAAVIGTTATLGTALMFGTPAAQASPSQPARTATGTASEPTARVEKIFSIQPDGTTVEVPPGTDLSAQSTPYYKWLKYATQDDCSLYQMCLYTGNGYTGWGLFMGGTLDPCEGFRFENTYMQGQTHSIWNNVEGGHSSIWDRYSDGSYNYNRYGSLPPGYHWPTNFSFIMDAWAFDPANNCTSLRLRPVVNPIIVG